MEEQVHPKPSRVLVPLTVARRDWLGGMSDRAFLSFRKRFGIPTYEFAGNCARVDVADLEAAIEKAKRPVKTEA